MLDTRSLRNRLLLIAAATIGLTLAVAGLVLTLIFEQHIERRLGEELSIQWNDLAGAISLDDKGDVAQTGVVNDPRFEEPASGLYWQVEVDDEPLLRSRSLWDQVISVPKSTAPSNVPLEIAGFEPGSVFYVLAKPVVYKSDKGPITARLMVAIDHEGIASLSEAFQTDVIESLGLIGLVLFIGAVAQAMLGLAPLAALRRKVSAIRSGEMTRLGQGFPSEVQPLAEDLDRLLDRQDALVMKARDRAGALAHGFKTPLTILTLEAHKLQESGETQAAAVLREQVETMRRHVERELAKARVRGTSVGGGALGTGKALYPSELADRMIAMVRRMPFSENLSIENRISPDIRVIIDRDDFGEVLGNLLDNARKFAASSVVVDAKVDGERVTVTVSDDGPGFGTDNGRNADGSGLGLSIVEDILAEYGATLEKTRVGEKTVLSFILAGERSVGDELLAAE